MKEFASSSHETLTLSPHKGGKLFSSTVANSRKAEIPACMSLICSRKAKLSPWKFREKTVTNSVSTSSGYGDPMLWELRVGGLRKQKHELTWHWKIVVVRSLLQMESGHCKLYWELTSDCKLTSRWDL